MAKPINRRDFLKASIATVANTALAANSTSALASPPGEQILGYNLIDHPTTAVDHFVGSADFYSGEVLSSFQRTLKKPRGYDNYFMEITEEYQKASDRVLDTHVIPVYDKTILLKAAIVQHWASTHYNYSMRLHDSLISAPIHDAHGHKVGEIKIRSMTDQAFSPQEVMKNGGIADCIDYTAAKTMGLLKLGIPPEDVMFVTGATHETKELMTKPFDQAGDYHAWAMVRSPGTDKWVILEIYDQDYLTITQTPHMEEIPAYYVPIKAIDGTGRMIFFDSLDSKGIPKLVGERSKSLLVHVDYGQSSAVPQHPLRHQPVVAPQKSP